MRIVVSAGGTGGHIYPALVVARELREMNQTVLFVGKKNGPEAEKAVRAGFEFLGLNVRGFDRSSLPNLLTALCLLPGAVTGALRAFGVFRPDAVIGVGGYASGPACIAATVKKIPLFLLEQNVYPGLVTRRMATRAVKVYTSFAESARWLGGADILHAGNPSRPEFAARCRLRKTLGTLLVLGGSQGAHSLNMAMTAILPRLKRHSLRVIHQTGETDYDRVKSAYGEHLPSAMVAPYFDNMAELMDAADCAVARAGASTCAELALSGLPALLVPYPGAGGHQKQNARSLVENGAAEIFDDAEDLGERLVSRIDGLAGNSDELERMSANSMEMAKPDAAKTITKDIMEILEAA